MSGARRGAAVGLWLLACTGGLASAAPADPPGALAAVRQQCIAAAQLVQRQEAALAGLQHQLDLLASDVAGRRRDLDDSRPQQAHLLGVLLGLSRNLDNPLAAAAEPPLDRRRGALLVRDIVPELRTEAHALVAESSEVRRLDREVGARRRALPAAQAALAQSRGRLAQLVAQRAAALHSLMPGNAAAAADLSREAAAKNVDELVKAADAAAERRARADAARGVTDRTRPASLRAFDPPQSALLLPVSGTISQRFGEPDATGAFSHSLEIAAVPGAEIVAPFDGQVAYVGQFRDQGLLLIIRHGGLYDSLLAGLGRADVVADQWVVAGEPIGSMPQPTAAPQGKPAAAAPLRFELRRNGQSIDPQPLLAGDASGPAVGDEQRMHE